MGEGGLEPPSLATLVPKTNAYTNSATRPIIIWQGLVLPLCPEWESNPHPLRDTILSGARIPIPPSGQNAHKLESLQSKISNLCAQKGSNLRPYP